MKNILKKIFKSDKNSLSKIITKAYIREVPYYEKFFYNYGYEPNFFKKYRNPRCQIFLKVPSVRNNDIIYSYGVTLENPTGGAPSRIAELDADTVVYVKRNKKIKYSRVKKSKQKRRKI